MSESPKVRRIAILGTAPTHTLTPWDDPTLEIWCLNDYYVLNPPRADRWYDLHPFSQFYYRDPTKKVDPKLVPPGMFIRPSGHVERLRRMTIPVYVQDAAMLDSLTARTFPKADVERAVGPFFASSPAWMVGHALIEGVTELHIYGIHLATEWEYLKQKPNLQFLLGVAAGRGVKLVVPTMSPLLKESHQYAYDVDPDIQKQTIQRRLESLQGQLTTVRQQAAAHRWYHRPDPNLASRMAWLQAQMADCQMALQYAIAGRDPAGV